MITTDNLEDTEVYTYTHKKIKVAHNPIPHK